MGGSSRKGWTCTGLHIYHSVKRAGLALIRLAWTTWSSSWWVRNGREASGTSGVQLPQLQGSQGGKYHCLCHYPEHQKSLLLHLGCV